MTSNVPGSGGAVGEVLDQWERWLADATDRLMDLENRAAGADVHADLAAAFVCRKAVAARVAEIRAAGDDARRLAAQPVFDDSGSLVADDLEGAATLLAAVIDRVGEVIGRDESTAAQIATDLMAATADLAVAERLAAELGHYVQRTAAVRQRLDAAGRMPGPLRATALSAAELRRELEGIATERDDLLQRWAAVPDTIERYRRREHEVRELVTRCTEKVRPLPKLATPSVDALGEPASLDELRDMTWPAARALIAPMLSRVERLGAAFDQIERRFGTVLAKRDELRGLLQAYRDKAGGSGLAEHHDLEPLFRRAERELWSAPCDVIRAEGLVAEYTAAVNALVRSARAASTDARPASTDRGAG